MKKLVLITMIGLAAASVNVQASLLGAPKWQFTGRVGSLDATIEGGSVIINRSADGTVMTVLGFDKDYVCQMVGLFNANPDAVSSFDGMEQTVTGSTLQWQSVPVTVVPAATCRHAVVNGIDTFAVDSTEIINGRQFATRVYSSVAGGRLAQQFIQQFRTK